MCKERQVMANENGKRRTNPATVGGKLGNNRFSVLET